MKPPYIAVALTFTLAMIASLIRFTIAGEPLWLDELHTAWASVAEFSDVFPRAVSGNQSPLFFWLSWGSLQAFGQSVIALRFVSLVSGVLLLLMAGRFVWRATHSVAGVLLTALLITFDWQFVFYATEARPYALMQLLGLAQAYCFVDLLGWFPRESADDSQTTRRVTVKWIALTALSIAMIYSHVTSVWLLVTEAVAVVGRRPKQALVRHRCFTISAITIAFASAPLLIGLRQSFDRRTNWSDLSSPLGVWHDLKFPLLIWFVLPLAVFAIERSRSRKTSGEEEHGHHFSRTLASPATYFVLLWALLPLASVSIVHALGIAPLALVRYTLIGYVALAIFAGLAIGRMRSTLVQGIAVGLVLFLSHQNNFLTQQLAHRGTLPHLRSENWREPIGLINGDKGKAQQPVFLFANVIEDVDAFEIDDAGFQAYLRFPVSGLDPIEAAGRTIHACPTNRSPHVLPRHFDQIAEQGGAWLVIRGRPDTVNAIVAETVAGVTLRLAQTNSLRTSRSTRHRSEGSDVYAVSIDLSSDFR